MLPEPTPRTLIKDLYRLDKEREQAHERVIGALMRRRNPAQAVQERAQIKADIASIRDHLRKK